MYRQSSFILHPLSFGGHLVAAVLLTLWGVGCTRSENAADSREAGSWGNSWREDLFDVAIDNLGHLEDFESAPMMQEIAGRLTQWLQAQEPPAKWSLDPLVATLPKRLAEIPQLRQPEGRDMTVADVAALREAVWLRDVAAWAAGPKGDPLARAKSLFDWTVRNIQLEPRPADETQRRVHAQLPWETLLLGRGTARDRAWVFVDLLRQQGLDAAILAIAPEKPASGDERLQPWAVGVRIPGEPGKGEEPLYLFDPQLGLTVARPDGFRRNSGGLQVAPTTLGDLAAHPEWLQQMSADKDHPYSIRAEDLKRVVALVAAEPTGLSMRMKMIQSRLAGKQRMVLTSSPSVQAETWKRLKHVGGAELWLHPFETAYDESHLAQRESQQRAVRLFPFQVGSAGQGSHGGGLWKARVLHLKGQFAGEDGAIAYYQAVRPSNEALAEIAGKLADQHYQVRRQMPTSRNDQQLRQESREQADIEVAVVTQAKQYASYWLGLIAYERGNFSGAIDYFARRTLEAAPNGRWTRGAEYNLGRSYEAAGERAKAIEQYRRSSDAGQLLRAKWLEEAEDAKAAAAG